MKLIVSVNAISRCQRGVHSILRQSSFLVVHEEDRAGFFLSGEFVEAVSETLFGIEVDDLAELKHDLIGVFVVDLPLLRCVASSSDGDGLSLRMEHSSCDRVSVAFDGSDIGQVLTIRLLVSVSGDDFEEISKFLALVVSLNSDNIIVSV